jgi:hypothetical protein
MKKILLSFLAMVLLPAFAESRFILDCTGMSAATALSNVEPFLAIPGAIEAVVVGPLFKTHRGPSDRSGIVYDFTDTGGTFLRGSYTTAFGTGDDLRAFAVQLAEKGVHVWSKVNPYLQERGYDRSFWASSDFTVDSQQFGPPLVVDIRSGSTVSKLDRIAGTLSHLPVDRWLVELDGLPPELADDYERFTADHFRKASALRQYGTNVTPGACCAGEFWTLREEVFRPGEGDFFRLTNFVINESCVAYAASDSTSVVNLGAIAFLSAKKPLVLIDIAVARSLGSDALAVLSDLYGGKVAVPSDSQFLIAGKQRFFALNLADECAWFDIPWSDTASGTWKSLTGSGMLTAEKTGAGVFLIPHGLGIWKSWTATN